MKTSPVKVWRRQKTLRKLLGMKGKIITWTVISVPGHKHKDQAPFPVILVQLENKQRICGQLVEYNESDLTTGKEVVSILRKVHKPSEDGVIAYGIKFRPAS
ncbi:hypothetical protein A3H80_02000 [Candidatus Roizmanbacteria bacterium RIFCSPLOWO2_02_FULL_37_19]|uniref:ChsH2 C-terminal OB-fold domain-containing protein n=1 Tax=Candidatus Roizmanbacteria bacterium RIFCSPHIGHO2_02_FULL_37_24 TaxID=1802037 RepID=A0A1F7H013_9BACT|nr:MAG: hypothetical protein A2862_02585 [Candidatus Roizmanbacteria bacterium RIFCSPHIGHO2_01_FULL_38_41]OGK24508.1 MAG: hypothetical protein A3C24_03080 [Candidatus Roizmanbacteria bacterium RIFCSPHIGHO2_02_FULL_37_24]OGK31962.1 MAG: hypothetical protein A3E10_04420 [Candidatus Roizmanbacteria bacterium RIFCSPHIGHO2_12_FULL_37_23]OGK43764.1 MAG: hypothetical protein A2956_04550 [Candidatus Roizmanbacteria bacterium RIFCSPLOWO2_01_FULL_37_57]OGK54317.1 MAG: hypothetical protein A3H80_02000 [Ca